MLCPEEPGPYDYPDSGIEGGELVDGSRPGYRQVAATLRQQILDGTLQAGEKLKAHNVLSAELGVSQATISAAVAMLTAEGLVKVEHGKPTRVLGRRRYRVVVDLPPAEEPGTFAAAAGALAVADAELQAQADGGLVIVIHIEASDAAQASVRALGVVSRALGEGWNVAGAAVSARPA